MRRRGRILLLLLGLLPLLAGCARKEGAVLGGIALRSDPPRALVRIDGRFAGETSPAGPLRIVLPEGAVQVRLSEAGHVDAVREVAVEAGYVSEIHVALAGWRGPAALPEGPVTLRVGQVARGWLPPPRPDGTLETTTYAISEQQAPRRLITTCAGLPVFRVLGPDGREVPLTKLEDRPVGNPGRSFHVFEAPSPGHYVLEVSGTGFYSFRYAQEPPPFADTDDPRLRGRRLPPPRGS